MWQIPEGLAARPQVEAQCTTCDPNEEAPKDSPVEERDRCYVWALDIEAGRELFNDLNDEKWERMTEDEKKAAAAEVEKRFEKFHPELGEEELTARTYPLPRTDQTITASVYYTDESMAVDVDGQPEVLYSMFLCLAVGESPHENACEAPNNAVAEVADTKFNFKSRVSTRVEVNGRPYSIGLDCERPSALGALTQ